MNCLYGSCNSTFCCALAAPLSEAAGPANTTAFVDDGGSNMPMPLIPDIAIFQRKLATLPLVTYMPDETVLSAASTTGRLLILKEGAVARPAAATNCPTSERKVEGTV